MANITGQLFLDKISILEIDGDPTVSGVDARKGSLAIETDSGSLWRKVGDNDRDWVEVFVNKSEPGQPPLLRLSSQDGYIDLSIPSSMRNSYKLSFPVLNPKPGQYLGIGNIADQLQWLNDGFFHPGLSLNKFYGSVDLIGDWSISKIPKNRLYAGLFYIPFVTNITRMGCEVLVSTPGIELRFGIYGINSNYEPGDLILDAGTVDASSVGLKETNMDLNLNPGWYYMVMATSGEISLRTCLVNNHFRSITGVNVPGQNNENLNVPFSFGPLPSVFPAVSYDSTARPWFWIRRV